MKAMKLAYADMLPDIGYVPAGVVELMTRQQQGWPTVQLFQGDAVTILERRRNGNAAFSQPAGQLNEKGHFLQCKFFEQGEDIFLFEAVRVAKRDKIVGVFYTAFDTLVGDQCAEIKVGQ